MMKPAVFSTAMVEAILNELKSHTRRLNGLEEINENPDDWFLKRVLKADDGFFYADFEGIRGSMGALSCIKAPYQPGDVLWVREKLVKGVGALVHYADGTIVTSPDKEPDFWHIKWKWKRDFLPSIFMPRYAARIFLEVLKVRVERLWDISEEDAKAEGFESIAEFGAYWNTLFGAYWNTLNGDTTWALSPWVFVYEFRRSECQP